MDDNKFLLDRLCFWIGCQSLIREGLLLKSVSLQKEFTTCKKYFAQSNKIDTTNKKNVLRLNRLKRLTLD